MIFRKPDAFIIKHVKIIHAVILLCMGYLLFKTNEISTIYAHVVKVKTIVGESNLGIYNFWMYLILIICLLLVAALMLILIKKERKFIFYAISLGILVGIFIFYILSYSNIKTMQDSPVAAPVYMAFNDFATIFFLIQAVLTFIYFIRATGFDVKTFTFNSEVLGIDLDETDSEEIELNVEIDSNNFRTLKRRKLRELRYKYLENRFKVNLALTIIIVIVGITIATNTKSNVETIYALGDEFTTSNYSIMVNDVFISNESYLGENIKDNDGGIYAIVLFKVKNQGSYDSTFDTAHMSLTVNDEVYYSSASNLDSFKDFGVAYKEQKLTDDYKSYYMIFKIPYEFSTKEVFISVAGNFNYSNNRYQYYRIKAEYKRIPKNENVTDYYLGEEASIKAYGIDTTINVSNYDIKKTFKLDYQYVVNEKTYLSHEYVVPTIDDNEDKVILKLTYTEAINDNDNKLNFSSILLTYGKIEYQMGEELKESNIYSFISPSKEARMEDTYYVQVSSELLKGKNRTIKIKIRDQIFRILLDEGVKK